MKFAKCLVWVVLAAGLFSVAGFAQTNGISSNGVINTVEGPMNAKDYQRAKEAALAESQKEYEEMIRHPELITNRPPSEWPFPNYQTGPGRPLPICVNFYCINDHYPTYLLCAYDVQETNYDQGNEPKWFKASLKQIRGSGPKQFPPIQWVAVMIVNRAERDNEKCCKVAAIFKTDDVFDSSRDLSQMIANAPIDRQPFKNDSQQPTPGEQQRWMIVERHAATNNPTTGPK
jgi:hypothetical protein